MTNDDLARAAALIPSPEIDRVLVFIAQKCGVRDAALMAIDYNVKRARDMGATWEQVGAALGVSRQAAQQRYGG